jgi:branched-chain amino acid transport system ATP-binding protein
MLQVLGLHAYHGRAHILTDVALEVGKGEVVALLGRNGAGKSTTLKSIMGLVPPARGEIEFDGRRIDRLETYAIAQAGLGYVPEDRRIFTELTVTENLAVGRQPARTGVPMWTTADAFKLFPSLASMPDRIAARMSGGEQQMLAIARSLMGNPSCILLDEPSEGLAPLVVDELARAIRNLKLAGVAALLSEQNMRFAAAVSDRAYIIEKGRIRFSGTMAELAVRDDVRAQYLAV